MSIGLLRGRRCVCSLCCDHCIVCFLVRCFFLCPESFYQGADVHWLAAGVDGASVPCLAIIVLSVSWSAVPSIIQSFWQWVSLLQTFQAGG